MRVFRLGIVSLQNQRWSDCSTQPPTAKDSHSALRKSSSVHALAAGSPPSMHCKGVTQRDLQKQQKMLRNATGCKSIQGHIHQRLACLSSWHCTWFIFGWWIFRRMAISVRKSPSAISSERLSTFAATCCNMKRA